MRFSEAFGAWAGYLGNSDWDELERFEDYYLGEWQSLSDYAEEFVEDLGLMDELERAVPILAPYVQVDFEGLGRDMAIGGDVVALETRGGNGIFVFQP